ncbi:MAG: porin family protein [Deltaproteobacteria bacterium]|nr:porin family protein [Deltaproteobacteria bacterium]MBW2385689.1 porin family protein [Deltaproteobacteria bacterium]MBW2695447.1 porin family protein [Deltaproteobacteria bacterium]
MPRTIRSIDLSRDIPLVLALLSLGLVAATAAADAEKKETSDYYLTAIAGGSFATGEAEGETFSGDFAGSSHDQSAFAGAALGTILELGFIDLRLELEGTGGRSFTFTTPSSGGLYVTDADVWTLQGNFWFEYSLGRLFPNTPIVRDLAPFGGGGLGLSRVSLATTHGAEIGRSDSSKLAWQGGVGLSYQPLPWLSFEARYQYIDMGGASVPLYSGAGRQGTMEIDLGANEVIGGIRFNFSEL